MPPAQDQATIDAIARGDIMEPSSAASTTDDSGASPPASAASEGMETPSSSSPPDSSEAAEAPSAAAEPAADDDKKSADDDKGPMVPQGRFKEAVTKERERASRAEAELQKLREREAQRAQAANFEESQAKVKEMLKQHSSLLADGDLEKAADVMEQVLQLRDDMNTARAEALAANTRDATRNEIKYDATVERLEVEYPEINPEADEFDEAAVRRVQAMMTGIMRTEGKSAADALVEATDILLKPLKEAKAKEALREKPSESAVEAGLRRTQQQIDKNIDAAAKQPPSTKEVGSDHDSAGGTLDSEALRQMSFEEFMKIPDEELAKLRGDVLQ